MAKTVKAPKPDPVMTGEQLQTALDRTGYSQSSFSRWLEVSDRTVRGWIGGEYPVPRTVQRLLSLMVKHKVKAEPGT